MFLVDARPGLKCHKAVSAEFEKKQTHVWHAQLAQQFKDSNVWVICLSGHFLCWRLYLESVYLLTFQLATVNAGVAVKARREGLAADPPFPTTTPTTTPKHLCTVGFIRFWNCNSKRQKVADKVPATFYNCTRDCKYSIVQNRNPIHLLKK